MNKRITIVILVLCIGIIFIIKSVNNKKTTPTEYPKNRTLEKKSYILGKFWPVEEIKIKSEVSGIVDQIFVKIGDSVFIGTDLAKLRIIPNPERLEFTKKTMQLSKVDLEQKRTDFKRNESLFNKGIISKLEFERFTQNYNNAKIEFNYAKKNYNIALKGFSTKKESRNIIKSTINGTVIDIPIKKGMNITERNNFNDGNTIAVIANISNFNFEFNIGENEINKIKINDEFEVTIKALDEININAKIIELKPASENKKEKFSYLVKAELLTANLPIKSGFTGLAEFLLESKKDVISIKEKNIIYKGRKAFVEVVNVAEKINKIEITRGISDGIYTEIKKGVSKKDRIKIQ
ncbi:MAG TPA: efflux RND transporter periplasmic adaptor subunit [Bacteroidia bacterium]|nr:efflux RND transporter periplasmic adaptor subunit [Bacteroidia bacterium]